MENEFAPGQKIPLSTGGKAEVLATLGRGGQGIVYRVRHNGGEYALKWYHRGRIASPDQFRENLQKNITDGPPGKAFLWPQVLTESISDNFGYLMDLWPADFRKFPDFLNKRVEFSHVATAVCCALNLVNNFGALHRQGKSYQDLNDGNFVINPKTGDVLIVDNDNVAPDKANFGIGGKPGYMAPEIVRGQARPNTLTDLHSLAVVLFKLFVRHDPLKGKRDAACVCLTEKDEKRLYGDDPLFIFDPQNDDNKPVPGVHPNPLKLWPLYPDYIREAFVRAFSEGVRDPDKRVTEHEWKKLLVRFRGEIWYCLSCGEEFFVHQLQVKEDRVFSCKKCQMEFSFPLRIVLNDCPVFLFPHNKLYACHTSGAGANAMLVTGEVLRNRKTGVWGIKNLSGSSWLATPTVGTARTINDGEVLPIDEGLRIVFSNDAEGVITQ
jgi:DNA-binding helix-hairpin-helix protein with protein kinase domain